MLKVKKSENIFFFERNAKYINYYTFSGIPLTPRLQKVIFFSPTAKSVLSKCRVAIAELKCSVATLTKVKKELKNTQQSL